MNFDPLSGIDEKQKEIMANYEFVMNAAGSVDVLWTMENAHRFLRYLILFTTRLIDFYWADELTVIEFVHLFHLETHHSHHFGVECE